MTTQKHWRDALAHLFDDARNADVMHTLGLRRSAQSNGLELLGVLAAGIVIGAGLAALFTPRSGPEMRQAIGQRATELKSTVSRRAEEMTQRARSAS